MQMQLDLRFIFYGIRLRAKNEIFHILDENILLAIIQKLYC